MAIKQIVHVYILLIWVMCYVSDNCSINITLLFALSSGRKLYSVCYDIVVFMPTDVDDVNSFSS